MSNVYDFPSSTLRISWEQQDYPKFHHFLQVNLRRESDRKVSTYSPFSRKQSSWYEELSLQRTGVSKLLFFEDSTYSLTIPLVLALALVLSLWESCAVPLSEWPTST